MKTFFRKDLELEKKWWHRMVKIFFFILSLFIFLSSVFGFYSLENDNSRQYTVIKNFADYTQEVRTNCLNAKDNSTSQGDVAHFPKLPNGSLDLKNVLSCYLLPIQSFLQENGLKDYSLGCLMENNKVEYLSDYTFKEGVTCTSGPTYDCTIPINICGGSASHVVKYSSKIQYNFSNYLSITLKTLGILLGWVLFSYLIYFKGFLYIVYGGKKENK